MAGSSSTALDLRFILEAYDVLLGREPENLDIVAAWLSEVPSRQELLRKFLSSQEFASAHPGILIVETDRPGGGYGPPIGTSPAIDIEWNVDERLATRLLKLVEQTWSGLGATEPHWSVLSHEAYAPDRIEENRPNFYASGKQDVDVIEGVLRRHGIPLRSFLACVEYGAGVGRVTQHLAARAQWVRALDISPNHLELAREWLAGQKVSNVELILASNLATFGMDEPFDFWFSRIVLQHNPPPIIAMILKRMFSMLVPGGVALFQVPTYGVGYSFSAQAYLDNPEAGKAIEMHCLPQEAVIRLASRAGCDLIEIREDNDTGHPKAFVSNTFLFRKPAQ